MLSHLKNILESVSSFALSLEIPLISRPKWMNVIKPDTLRSHGKRNVNTSKRIHPTVKWQNKSAQKFQLCPSPDPPPAKLERSSVSHLGSIDWWMPGNCQTKKEKNRKRTIVSFPLLLETTRLWIFDGKLLYKRKRCCRAESGFN